MFVLFRCFDEYQELTYIATREKRTKENVPETVRKTDKKNELLWKFEKNNRKNGILCNCKQTEHFKQT